MKMELIEGSETSNFKTQTPGKYPKENILYTEHGESLKSRNIDSCLYLVLLFQVSVLKISSVLLLNVVPLFSSVPKLKLYLG